MKTRLSLQKATPTYTSGELNLIKGLQVTEVQKKLGADKPKEASGT